MRRSGVVAMAAVLAFGISAPAWPDSARRDDKERDVKTKPKAARQSEPAGASQEVKASDTLVVPASADHPGFTMVGENVTYADPSFVPYKLREAARRARASVDIAKIP